MHCWTPEKIRELRNLYGETQVAFARRLGVTPTSLRYWEWDMQNPSGSARILLDRLREDVEEGKIRELV